MDNGITAERDEYITPRLPMKIVYADNNATTAVAPEVVEAMGPFLAESYFNPARCTSRRSGSTRPSSRARQAVARHFGARRRQADPLHRLRFREQQHGDLRRGQGQSQPAAHHHHLGRAPGRAGSLQGSRSATATRSPGWTSTATAISTSASSSAPCGPETLLVSIMHANNETGVIFPIEQLARLTKETDPAIVFHCDATQSVGKMRIDLGQAHLGWQHVDLLSFSGHKLHAPKGIGVLYIKPGTPCRPLLIGGHQEAGRRAGTENMPYIVGLARAMELAEQYFEDEETRVRGLRDRLERSIEATIPNVQVNGRGATRLPNTLNVSCHFVEGEGMLYQLSDVGICASSGSACTSGSLEPSHVLRAMKVPFTAVHGSVRFSLSRYNTDGDIDHILKVFPGIVANLRRLSPYWDQGANAPKE